MRDHAPHTPVATSAAQAAAMASWRVHAAMAALALRTRGRDLIRPPELADEPHFRLQPHPTPRPHNLLDQTHQLADIGRRGGTKVDDEVRVLLRDLSTALRRPLQSGLLDQPTGILAGWVLENRAGVWIAGRLIPSALFLNPRHILLQPTHRRAEQTETQRSYHGGVVEFQLSVRE